MIRGVPPLLPWQPCLLAAVAGILAQDRPLAAVAAFLLLCLFPRPAPGRPRTWQLLLSFLAGLGTAMAVMPARPAAVPAWATDGKPQALVGRVSEIRANPGGRLACLLDEVHPADGESARLVLPGRLGLTVDGPTFRPLPGDVLAFSAKIRPTRGFVNPGVVDFAFLRRLEGVFFRAYVRGPDGLTRLAQGGSLPARIREGLRRLTQTALAPPDDAPPSLRAGRAMVATLLFGDRSGFAPPDLELVRRGSLAHTLALSGMHVAYVVSVGFGLVWLLGRCRPRLFLRLPRPYLALAATLPLVAGYCWLGGYSPSLYRAVLMFAGGGALFLLGRQAPPGDVLFLALAVLLLASPLTALDIRLQLSALAVAGIILFWSPLRRLLDGMRLADPWRRVVLWLLAPLWVGLCAEAAVMPVIARTFGEVPFNPWINVLWLPILGFVVLPLSLLGLLLLPIPLLAAAGTACLLTAAWCCQGLMAALDWLNGRGLLLSAVVLRPSWPEMLGCFGLLACAALVVAGRPRPRLALLVSCGLLVAPTIWRDAADSRAQVSLTVLDVGQGQAVVIGLPDGRRLVVDGGGLPGSFDVGRAVVSPFLTDGRPPRLDAVMASHPHADHIKGLEFLLAHFAVGRFLDNGGVAAADLGKPLLTAAAAHGIAHAALQAGDRLDLGQGLALEVLHPQETDDRSGNNGSLVLRLTWNGRGLAVLPGDAERGVLHRLANTGVPLAAEVLVLPHHGAASGLSRRFNAAVAPRIAIASCGDIRPSPAAKVVRQLTDLGCATYATNRCGAVSVRFDGPAAPGVVTPSLAP